MSSQLFTDEELAEKITALEPVVKAAQEELTQDDDPWGFAEAQELLKLQRMQSRRSLNKLHPGNRFRLMFGQPLLAPHQPEALSAVSSGRLFPTLAHDSRT